METTEAAPPPVVCDAGPVIHLDELECLDLLHDFADVIVPVAVRREIEHHRPAALRRRGFSWREAGRGSTSATLSVLARVLPLHSGEVEALRVAIEHPGAILLTDDAAARLAAQSLDIRVRGTIGILLRSIRRAARRSSSRRQDWLYSYRRLTMTLASSPRRSPALFVILTMCLFIAISNAQQGRRGIGPDTLPDEPQILGFGDQRFRVVPIKGFFRPSAVDFLPNGDILVAERSGGLRIIRDGVLDPEPIRGMPEVHNGFGGRLGLWDVAVHPQFAENRLVYFTYLKPDPSEDVAVDAAVFQGIAGTSVLARGRYDGANTLTDVEDIFVSDARVSGFSVARLIFAPDGKIFMSIGMPLRDQEHGGSNRVGTAEQSQEPGSHAGKILRLNDDGTAPEDNPFVGDPAYRPEIYALGFRDPLGLIIHPETGELWEVEHGPQGGDELNIVRPGRNYGWPIVSYGRAYTGEATIGAGGTGPELPEPCAPGMEQPLLYWYPVISPGGMALYTGDAFPAWKGSLFVGGMSTTQLQRIVLNQRGLPVRHIPLLTELNQRIRDVKQGPDGLLYVTTDHEAGAVLRIEPLDDAAAN